MLQGEIERYSGMDKDAQHTRQSALHNLAELNGKSQEKINGCLHKQAHATELMDKLKVCMR
jgi:hypothetical protein